MRILFVSLAYQMAEVLCILLTCAIKRIAHRKCPCVLWFQGQKPGRPPLSSKELERKRVKDSICKSVKEGLKDKAVYVGAGLFLVDTDGGVTEVPFGRVMKYKTSSSTSLHYRDVATSFMMMESRIKSLEEQPLGAPTGSGRSGPSTAPIKPRRERPKDCPSELLTKECSVCTHVWEK